MNIRVFMAIRMMEYGLSRLQFNMCQRRRRTFYKTLNIEQKSGKPYSLRLCRTQVLVRFKLLKVNYSFDRFSFFRGRHWTSAILQQWKKSEFSAESISEWERSENWWIQFSSVTSWFGSWWTFAMGECIVAVNLKIVFTAFFAHFSRVDRHQKTEHWELSNMLKSI